jgi:uncharacterized protein YehS (DUF1456 family)
MNNNDIPRRLRYALNISNPGMAEIFKLAGYDISEAEILTLLKKEEEEGYVECGDPELSLFLDGLIVQRRGRKDGPEPEPEVKPEVRITNNLVLKKLRIALNFKEEDMLAVFKLADFDVSKPELSAVFRKKGHKNYKPCKDQMLKNFLQGLTIHLR